MNNKPAVVYLSWVPYGIDCLKSFIISYKQYCAGVEHDLVLLFNGIDKSGNYLPFLNYAENITGKKIKYLLLDKGQDIDAYYFAAQHIPNQQILFLNSFSRVLADNWLSFYVTGMDNNEKAIIGATSSCHSHYSNVFSTYKRNWEHDKSFGFNFRKYKLFLKAFFYWRFIFKPYPNPHLRTSAFMTKKEDFMNAYPGPLINKFNAYKFESGRKSLTNQLIKRGFKILVVGKDGKTYEPGEWKESKTFWISEQENLLISDNQTDLFASSSSIAKKELSMKAWGVNA